jgi:hypothetical protein
MVEFNPEDIQKATYQIKQYLSKKELDIESFMGLYNPYVQNGPSWTWDIWDILYEYTKPYSNGEGDGGLTFYINFAVKRNLKTSS